MSDSDARRSFDTVVIPAALVFPGDPVPSMGPDTLRIPVRVVWRPADPQTPGAAVGRSPRSFREGTSAAGMGGNPNGDDWNPDAVGAPEPARSPSGDLSRTDPVARFLKVKDALDRIAGAAARETPEAAAAIRGDPSRESFDEGALEYRTKNVNNSTARALGMSRYQLRDAIHDLKDALGLRGDDDLELDVPSGDVFFYGEKVGNPHDE